MGTRNEILAQPYGGAPPGGSSVSIANVPIGLEAVATLPVGALRVRGVVAQPASGVSVAILAVGPDGRPLDDAAPREVPATLNPGTLAFLSDLPEDLEPGTYALYVNDVLVGRFTIVGTAGPSPDAGSGGDSGSGLGSASILLLAVLGAVALIVGGLFVGRARGY